MKTGLVRVGLATLILGAGTCVSVALAGGDDHGHAAPKAPAKPAEPTKHAEPAKGDASKANAKPNAKDADGPANSASEAHAGAARDLSAKGEARPDSKSATEATPGSPDEALKALSEGNERWVSGKTRAPNSDAQRRKETAAGGQSPFAAVLTCADSRLPVERVFDRGVGDVFVARVAGNVVGPHCAGTLEYGIEHLHIPLVVVMGHTRCGAVKAACEGAKAGGNVDSLLDEIKPAVARAKSAHPDESGEALADNAVRENVWQSVFGLLKTSSVVREGVHAGKVRIVGAVCDVATGKVEFLGEHPWQEQLLQAMSTSPAGTTAQAEESKH